MSTTKPLSILGFVIAVLSTMLVACGGLDPSDLPPPSVLRGEVVFEGGADAWPDSIRQVLVVGFENVPTTSNEVIASVLGGTASFSDTLALYSNSDTYEFEVIGTPRTFSYVVVAMQNGPSLLSDWLMASVYSTDGDPSKPSSVTILPGDSVTINFSVDFENLPPQPFE